METMLVLFREATSSKKYLNMDNRKLYRIAFDYPLAYSSNHSLQFSEDCVVKTNPTDFSKWIRRMRPLSPVFRDFFMDRKNKTYIIEAMSKGLAELAQNAADNDSCHERLEKTWKSIELQFSEYAFLVNKAYGNDVTKNIANTLYLCAMSIASDAVGTEDQREEHLYAMFSDHYEEYMMRIMPLAFFNKYRIGPLKQLANEGNAIAAQELGDMFYYGTELYYDKNESRTVIKESKEKAYYYYCIAADKGYPFSLWAQGDMLLNMIAPQGQMDIIANRESKRRHENLSQKELIQQYAVCLFKKACKIWSKCAPAYNSIGAYYEQQSEELARQSGNVSSEVQRENLVNESKVFLLQSIQYFLISYHLGLEFSRNRLIRIHEEDPQLLKRSVIQGYRDELGVKRSIHNYDRFIKSLYEECDENNAYGQNRLGMYYLNIGEKEKAEEAFKRAAALGEKWGEKNLEQLVRADKK